ncbi:MAG TPA: hypothetical protein VEF03_00510, partial [Candidatus Binataceae bacterium]|nr:hypothetical protein [Candidatus Binataceae bacterium]
KPLERKEASWIVRPLYSYLKRTFGKELTPYKIWAYRPRLLLGATIFTGAIELSKGLDTTIRSLVSIRAAQVIGCPF